MGLIRSLPLLACLWLAAIPALAQEHPEEGAPSGALSEETIARAKELFQNGTLLYDEGSYDAAVAAFREAYELTREPLMLYNMASALERMGAWQEAVDALDGYRAFAPADERDILERRIRALEKRVEEKRDQERRDAEEAARLAAEAQAAAAPPPEPLPPPRRGPSAGAVALWGTGAVGVGLGTVFTARTLGARAAWKGECVEGPNGLLCPSDASELVRRDKTSAIVADVSWGVGLLALGGGLVVSLSGKGGAQDVALSLRPDGVTVGGSW